MIQLCNLYFRFQIMVSSNLSREMIFYLKTIKFILMLQIKMFQEDMNNLQ